MLCRRVVGVVVLLLAAAVGIPSLFAGGQSDSGSAKKVQLEVLIWKPEATDGYEAWAKRFNELNPNITVAFTGNNTTYRQILEGRLAANNPPDLIGVYGGNMGFPLAKQGHLLDLSDQAFLKKVQPGILEGQKFNGKIYSLPIDSAPQGFLYNKGIFKDLGISVPASWDELEAAMDKIQQAGIIPNVIAGKDNWTLGILIDTLAAPLVYGPNPQFDMEVINGKKSFTGPEWTKAMAFYDRLRKYSNKDIASLDYSLGNQLMATGKAAMVIQGLWDVAAIEQLNPDIQLGFFVPPVVSPGSKTTLILGADFTLGVSSKTPNKKEALKFLDFLTSKEAVDIWVTKVKTINSMVDAPMDFHPIIKDVDRYLKQNAYVYPFPNHMWFMENVLDDWTRKVQEYNLGTISTADSLKALEVSLKEAYKQFNK
jgi:raffinose/stachyose/melibiose transport system substrate-binding protein